MARRILRARDHTHHHPWRVLIIAGPEPKEEIRCIRALMPQAHITAIDIEAQNVEAAKKAGADVAIICDVADYEIEDRGYSGKVNHPPAAIGRDFDAICLDLTGPANEWLYRLVGVYLPCLKRGVLIVTSSYGRDVLEAYQEKWRMAKEEHRQSLEIEGMPEPIRWRLHYLLRGRAKFLQSCIQYRGKVMPMLSCLLWHRTGVDLPPATYCSIEPGDFERAVTGENIGDIYACPPDRILALRRSMAAQKAVKTRRQRQKELAL